MAAEVSATGPIRILVVGAGPAAAAMHLPVLAQLRATGSVELVQICDLQPGRAESAREKFGFNEAGGDAFAALARADIDAAYIFGSAQLHYECGLAALRGGKHLFVEKPIAPSHLEALELAGIAEAHSLIAVGGHNRRFYRSLATARERAGKAGWRFAEAVFHKPEFGKPALFGARTWLSANGIHALDALLHAMGGLPEYLSALSGESNAPQASMFSAVMRWRNGAQGIFLCNNNAGARREEYVFHSPAETCSVFDTELIVSRDGLITRTEFASVGDGVRAEHESFLQAIRGGESPPHALAALAPSLFLAELIESAFSGRVEFPAAPASLAKREQDSSSHGVLIAQCTEVSPTLMRLLPGARLVSLEEVRSASQIRPDIGAAILGSGAPPLSSEDLRKLPRLGIVGIVGLSVARHAPELLLERGIAVVNASGAHAESVAEFALGLAILGRRRAFSSHDVMRSGGWGVSPKPRGVRAIARRAAGRWLPAVRRLGLEPALRRLWAAGQTRHTQPADGALDARELRGSTVGVIGWSANARAFSRRLTQAGAHVIGWSEYATAAQMQADGATQASLGEVLAADVVSLHRGLTPKTLHFLGAAELARLRPGAVLINVARGALIEPRALEERLRRGDVFACLDTFENEPLDASHPLRGLPNVFLTSHIAGGSKDMRAAAAQEVAQKIVGYLSRGEVQPITAERLRTMT